MPPLVAKRLQEFPLTWLDKINWVATPPSQEEYTVLIDTLITEVLKVPE